MWIKVKGYKNYSINENGEVRNDNTNQIKAQRLSNKGYYIVDLWENNKGRKMAIHRLVAEAFIPNPENKPCVDHIDGNRKNNSISNLRWATYSENNSRFDTYGVRSEKIMVTHYEEVRNKRGGGHISWGEIDHVIFFNKIRAAAKFFGVSDGNISQMLKIGTIGKRGKMRGYKFEYYSKL